jgi:hypothetical protein
MFHERKPHVPVVAMSGYALPRPIARRISCG